MTLKTIYGTATIVSKTPDGDYLLCIKREDMTTPHPNFRGGKCVFWISDKKELE